MIRRATYSQCRSLMLVLNWIFLLGSCKIISCYFSLGSGELRVLASQVRSQKAGIHIELHLLGHAPSMINDLIVFKRLITGVIPLCVLHVQSVANFCHISNLFYQVIQVKN